MRLSEVGDRLANAGRFNRVSAAPQSLPCPRCRPRPSTSTTDYDPVDECNFRRTCDTLFRIEQAIALHHQSRVGEAHQYQRYRTSSKLVPPVPKSVKVCRSATTPRRSRHTSSAKGYNYLAAVARERCGDASRNN